MMTKSIKQLQVLLRELSLDKEINKGFVSSSKILADALNNGNKILIAGNGGSAAEAQHFAAEIVGRFKVERKGYPAISLTTDTSIITAISNDYGYSKLFSRQIEALGNPNDVLVVLSTSGNSKNCIEAIKIAKKIGMVTISLLGKTGGEMKGMSDIDLVVKSSETARIQEIHLLIIHSWCEHVEASI